jgi:hypothetical protein
MRIDRRELFSFHFFNATFRDVKVSFGCGKLECYPYSHDTLMFNIMNLKTKALAHAKLRLPEKHEIQYHAHSLFL